MNDDFSSETVALSGSNNASIVMDISSLDTDEVVVSGVREVGESGGFLCPGFQTTVVREPALETSMERPSPVSEIVTGASVLE